MTERGEIEHDGGARRPQWSERVALAPSGRFAYVPGRIVVRERDGARARRVAGIARGVAARRTYKKRGAWLLYEVTGDALDVVEALRADGVDAQPEHAFFAHCAGCPCPPHPALAYDLVAGGLGADPFRGHPFRGHPFRGHPFRGHESPESTAAPAAGRELPARGLAGGGRRSRIVVLDTGLAGGIDEDGAVDPDGQRPALLAAAGSPPRITGPIEHADNAITTLSGTVYQPDGYLDPVSGHGTFIAGLIEQLAPGCEIRVEYVTSPMGDVQEFDVAEKLFAEAFRPPDTRPDIVSMSFGGPVMESPDTLRSAVAAASLAGIVVVASAGNDATCEPQFPAALPQVIAVGAVGPEGPAPFTNYGDWVDASAPGVDLVSAFFKTFDGKYPTMNTVDPDRFAEWAVWSGTSFSAPVVVAAMARALVESGDPQLTARQAADRVVRAPHLPRLPWLGTVVSP